MKKFNTSLIALLSLTTLASCINLEKPLQIRKEKKKSNRVTNTKDANAIIGDAKDNIAISVINENLLKKSALNKSFKSIANAQVMSVLSKLPQGPAAESISESKQDVGAQEESLIVGFPIGLIGEQNLFGGVITKVSDKQSENLGNLKMTDLAPINVRTIISRLPDGNPALTLVGCAASCDEESNVAALINLPIVGLDEKTGNLMIDMSSIGKELDLITMLDPLGQYTELRAISSDTVAVEYDTKTLLFDVKTRMVPLSTAEGEENPKITEFTVRWYMKLNSGLNPAFKTRAPVEGVGFFLTDRSVESKITRFHVSPNNGPGQATIKYYIKNVPKEYEKFFTGAIDAWNKQTSEILGRPLLSYEILEKDDERFEQIIPGDIRYNVIEWDLVNIAVYGGLGPSIAHQHTGEILSASTLIQGPMIEKLYKEWFGISKQAEELLAQGKTQAANKIMRDFDVKVSKDIDNRKKIQFKLKLGKHLNMVVHSQRPELEDPIKRGFFDMPPVGYTYMQYMEGYITEMVAHELGHNLGLRHNFKGNLGAYESNEKGSVSRSIMEYLGRAHRHKSHLGLYDKMAIAYGYKGIRPKHKDWFCTDEHQGKDAASMKIASPECSSSDATSDPFSYFEARLGKVLDLLLESKSESAPVWKLEDMKTQFNDAITGIASYAISAENTAESWTNFFGKADRPEEKSEIKPYVLKRIKKKLCDPENSVLIASKESPEAQKIAANNLAAFAKAITDKTSELGVYTAQELKCGE